MTEEWLRAWTRDHELLVEGAIAVVVGLVFVVRAVWWFRRTDLSQATGDLFESAVKGPAARAVPPERPLDPRTARVASLILAVLGVAAVALAVSFSWMEYDWMGAEVVRAPFVDSSAAGGTVTARYQVASTTRPPFTATFSYTPRGGNMTGVSDAMHITRVLEVHRGDPLRYREYSRSTSRDLRGWALIKFDAALGAAFGGLFLLFAFKLYP